MTPHLDPNLVAGFAAEARSHLPEIRRTLEGADGAPDSDALGAVYRQISSMRDASSIVGLEPLGRALHLFAEKLLRAQGGRPLVVPLRLLEEYLEGLEEKRNGLAEPGRLLSELASVDGAPSVDRAPGEAPDAISAEPADRASGKALGTVSGMAPGGVIAQGESSEDLEASGNSPQSMPAPVLGAASDDLELPPWVTAATRSSEDRPAGDRSAADHLPGPSPSGRESQSPLPAQKERRKTVDEGPSAAVLEIFAAESDEHAQAISKLLGELSTGRFMRDTVSSLRRRVHNLKGSAALVKLEELSRVAHGMEDLLDIFYEQRRAPRRSELTALELAGDALQALVYRRGEVAVDEVLATLAEALRGPGAGSETVEVLASPRALGVENKTAAVVSATLEPELTVEVATEPSLGGASRQTATVDTEDTEATQATEVESAEQEPEHRRFVRVSVDALDEVMRLLVEVDAERHHLRGLVAEQKDHSLELDLADRRLRREVRALENDLEVAALGSGMVRSSGRAAETPFDALELDQYSELHERSRSLIESTSDLETVRADLSRQILSMDHSIERLGSTAVRLRDRVLGLRLVPFSTLTPRLEGVVRLAARETGKEARLTVDDGGVELDKDVLDSLVDPLDHLLRNAVAHGIESPAERARRKKEPLGAVRLVASYGLGGVTLRVSDDGGGINVESVVAHALERNLLGGQKTEGWSEEDKRSLIFEPGLSTAAEIDHVAGRGVGMDIVRQRLRELRGLVSIEESSAAGTVFRLELPTTLAVQRVLLVQDGGHRLALPSSGLERMERIAPNRLEKVGEREVLRAGHEIFQVVHLARSAGLAPGDLQSEEDPIAIFTRQGGRPTAFLVEAIFGAREVVVQDLGRHVGRLPGLLGVTQVGAGHPVPILDPDFWLQDSQSAPSKATANLAKPRERATVLVVDDSLSMRRYLRQLVERFGYPGIAARDGLEAMEILDTGTIDPGLILLDLEMPRMDGFELMSTLRSDARFAGIPRVVLTSRDAAKHRNRAKDEGADGYLVKPVAESELEATLTRLIRQEEKK